MPPSCPPRPLLCELVVLDAGMIVRVFLALALLRCGRQRCLDIGLHASALEHDVVAACCCESGDAGELRTTHTVRFAPARGCCRRDARHLCSHTLPQAFLFLQRQYLADRRVFAAERIGRVDVDARRTTVSVAVAVTAWHVRYS